MKVISEDNQAYLQEAAELFRAAHCSAALSGAGISVASGIPDFRSPGGLWSVYAPEEYATLDVFYQNPEKAWELYRALGMVLLGKQPNDAHRALAELEQKGFLQGIVTQNVDGLHQAAGSKRVYEVHGDHQHLQCLSCDYKTPVVEDHYHLTAIPLCPDCQAPLKPNVVLFGEAVRDFHHIESFMSRCDLLFVIGTSAQVYPAAGIPQGVKQRGGIIFEFNHEAALGVDRFSGISMITDYFFHGDSARMLPLFAQAVNNAK